MYIEVSLCKRYFYRLYTNGNLLHKTFAYDSGSGLKMSQSIFKRKVSKLHFRSRSYLRKSDRFKYKQDIYVIRYGLAFIDSYNVQSANWSLKKRPQFSQLSKEAVASLFFSRRIFSLQNTSFCQLHNTPNNLTLTFKSNLVSPA
jgi:hypothetical protein